MEQDLERQEERPQGMRRVAVSAAIAATLALSAVPAGFAEEAAGDVLGEAPAAEQVPGQDPQADGDEGGAGEQPSEASEQEGLAGTDEGTDSADGQAAEGGSQGSPAEDASAPDGTDGGDDGQPADGQPAEQADPPAASSEESAAEGADAGTEGETGEEAPEATEQPVAVADYGFEYTMDGGTLTVTSVESTDLVVPAEVDGVAVTALYADGVGLTSLDVSACASTLAVLSCNQNQLAALDLSGCAALSGVYCNNNVLTSIAFPEQELYRVDCSYNELTSIECNTLSTSTPNSMLNCSYNNLTYLKADAFIVYCSNNQITQLDVSAYALDCSFNQLTTLDLSDKVGTGEGWLDCSYNRLVELYLPENTFITGLQCNDNQLTELVVPNAKTLDCSNNQLKSLTICLNAVNSLPAELRCSNNQLEELDFSQCTDLAIVDCSNNQLTQIDVVPYMATDVYTYGWLEEGIYINCSNNCIADTSAIDAWIASDERFSGSTANQNVAPAGIAIDEANFPDEAFRTYVANTCDLDGDGVLSEDEQNRRWDFGDLFKLGEQLYSLKGIEYFPNTYNLCIENTSVSELDATALPNLTALRCYGTQITELDLSACPELVWLYCSDAPLERLILGDKPRMQLLDCSNTQISTLDVSGCSALRFLGCSDTNLTSLDLSNLTQLYQFNCSGTDITSVNLGGLENLYLLGCPVEALSSFDADELQNIALLQLSGNTSGLDLSTYGNLSEVSFVDGVDSVAYLNLPDTCSVWVGAHSYVNEEGMWHFYQDGERITEATSDACLTVPSDSFDLASYYPGIEASRISNVTGASIDGTLVSGYSNGSTISYSYECGATFTGELTLNVTLTLTVDESLNTGDEGETYPFEYTMRNGMLTVTSSESTNLAIPAEVDGVAVTSLYVYGLGLTSLDVSSCASTLTYLSCISNALTELDLSGCTALRTLYCGENQIASLNLDGCTALEVLNCQDNALTSLDLSDCPYLWSLVCSDNRLTTLDLSANTNLAQLLCGNNSLSTLDVSMCPLIWNVRCPNNSLVSLVLPASPVIEQIDCSNNLLTSLDLSNTDGERLWYVNCSGNSIVDTSALEAWLAASDMHTGSILPQSVPFQLTVDLGDGSAAGTAYAAEGAPLATVLGTPQREGYSFEGWYLDEALTQPLAADALAEGDIAVYAKWVEAGDGSDTPGTSENPDQGDAGDVDADGGTLTGDSAGTDADDGEGNPSTSTDQQGSRDAQLPKTADETPASGPLAALGGGIGALGAAVLAFVRRRCREADGR